jgi:predicted ATP-grasp superfamily ATP-dependent carboligase
MTLRRVFLFEYLSAGGTDVPAALRAEGIAMRDALCSDLSALSGWSLGIAADPRDPLGAPATGAIDGIRGATSTLACGTRCGPTAVSRGTHWLARCAGEPVVDFVAREAARHDQVWVVAPETGGVLAALCEVVPQELWIGCDRASIRLTSSKRASVDRLHARGVATPHAFIDDPDVSAWVVKPDDGAGSVDTRRHLRLANGQADLVERREAAVLEPWVDGEALSLSLLIGANGAELLAVNRQHVVVDSQGVVSLEGIEVNLTVDGDKRAALARTASAVCAAIPGLAGLVGIDLVWHATRGPVVIEVNPRVTSAYVGLGAALGRNLAGEVLALSPTSDAMGKAAPTTAHGAR